MGAVEAKGAGLNLGEAGVALGAGKLLGENQGFAAFHVSFDHAVAFAERSFHRLGDSAQLGVRPHD